MSEDSEDEGAAPGAAKAPGIIKGGCGIRFDPDELSEDTGFDFSEAEKLKPGGEHHQQDEDET